MLNDNGLGNTEPTGRSIDRLWYRARTWLSEPTIVFGLILSIFFAYLILSPVLLMLFDAITIDFADKSRAGGAVGEFTLYYLRRALSSRISLYIFWKPLLNTAIVSLCVIVITLTLGSTLGWLVSRTDLLGRRWFSTALVVPYMVPSWTFALAWLAIFRNRTTGGLNGWVESLGFNPPD